jgi:homoserine O-acetyltransferase
MLKQQIKYGAKKKPICHRVSPPRPSSSAIHNNDRVRSNSLNSNTKKNPHSDDTQARISNTTSPTQSRSQTIPNDSTARTQSTHSKLTPNTSYKPLHTPQHHNNLEKILHNDELVINSLLDGIKTIQNPFTRKIIIHKPFRTVLGHVLPHLEIEFLDISNSVNSNHIQRHLVQHQTSERLRYQEELEKVLKADPVGEDNSNQNSVPKMKKNIQNRIVYDPTNSESLPPSDNKLSYSNTPLNIPITVIEPYYNTIQNYVEKNQHIFSIQNDQTNNPLKTTQDELLSFSQLPVTFAFPSMSHSSNLTNPIHYDIFSSRLNRQNHRHFFASPNSPNSPPPKPHTIESISNLYGIPEHLAGEPGWWNSFARPSLKAHKTKPSSTVETINVYGSLGDEKVECGMPVDLNVAIDLDRTRLISISPLGSAYGSSSPLSPNPVKVWNYQQLEMERSILEGNEANVEPIETKNDPQHTPTNPKKHHITPSDVCFRGEFPLLTPFDQATAAVWLLDALGLVQVHKNDNFVKKPLVTEVLPGIPSIIPHHLLQHTMDNYHEYFRLETELIKAEGRGDHIGEIHSRENDDKTDQNGQNSQGGETSGKLDQGNSTDAKKFITHPTTPSHFPYHKHSHRLHDHNTHQIHPNHIISHTAVVKTLETPPRGRFQKSPILAIQDDFPLPTLPLLTDETVSGQLLNVIGSSMGGQSALAFTSLYPNIFSRCAVICSTSRTTPHTQAIRSIQRRCVTNDSLWDQGDFHSKKIPQKGLQLSRMIGMLNYRSIEEFNIKFDSTPTLPMGLSGGKLLMSENNGEDIFYQNDVEFYLQHVAEKFNKFNPLCYVTLSKSMDLMDISMVTGDWMASVQRMGRGSVGGEGIEKKRKTEYLLLGIKEDELIPFNELEILGQKLGPYAPTHYETISSLYGHDGFLLDLKLFGPRLSTFLLPPPVNHTSGLCSQQKSFGGIDAVNRYLKSID